MTKQDLMNYVTETPENVNKNILSQKIDQYVEETGGGNAVQYVPQELTEAQQMQARKNMGLPYSESVYPVVYDWMYLLGSWDVFETTTLMDGVGFKYDANYIISVDGTEYKCKGCRTGDIVAGAFEGVAFIGNINMLPSDLSGPFLLNEFLDINDFDVPDCPVGIHHEISDGAALNISLHVDPNFQTNNGMKVKIFEVSDEAMQTVYHPIETEYLPKAEAVSDAAGDAPTADEFNALLNALRNAGYLAN